MTRAIALESSSSAWLLASTAAHSVRRSASGSPANTCWHGTLDGTLDGTLRGMVLPFMSFMGAPQVGQGYTHPGSALRRDTLT